MSENEQKTVSHVDISGRRLARNTVLNFVGRIVPMLVGIFTIPYIIHHLGPDRYGLYSLAWIVVGYFGLFNLGIGPATTKFVAELLGKGDTEKLSALVWTAIVSQTALGLAGGLVLAISSPFLVRHLLKIPADLHSQAEVIFLIMAALLPLDFASASLQGVLGASQRFDLLNMISVPTSCFSLLLPVVILALGFGLPAVVLSLAIMRVVALCIVLYACIRLHPALLRFRFELRLFRSLLGFGGWVAVTGAIGSVLLYTDTLFIGALDSVAAVGYYSFALRVTSYMLFIPTALGSTLLPAFSSLQGLNDPSRTLRLFLKSYKYVFLVTTPTLLALIVFARNIFTIWVGSGFAAQATLPFQILALGTMVSLFGPIANALLSGRGRPDIISKIYMFHLPVNTLVVWYCVTHWGIVGAAISATIRSALDAALLFYFSVNFSGAKVRELFERQAIPVIGAVVFSLLLIGVVWAEASQPVVLKAELFAGSMAAYAFVTYKFALRDAERKSLWQALSGAWLRFQQS